MKQFPPQVKDVNMIFSCNKTKRERKLEYREIYAVEPSVPQFMPWSDQSIFFDQSDHLTSVHHGGKAALVLDPIVKGCHLNKVLIDGGSSLNLIYVDTMKKMGINETCIKPTNTRFRGIIPGTEAEPVGKITLDMVFGTLETYRSEPLEFEVVPFPSGYHALLSSTAFVQLQAVPHYAYLKLKMPGLNVPIIISGDVDRSYKTEDTTDKLSEKMVVAAEFEQLRTSADPEDIKLTKRGKPTSFQPSQDIIKFQVHPEDPTKMASMGSGLDVA